MDLETTLERQRGTLDVGLKGAVGAWSTAKPTTGCLVADVAPERDSLIADLALRHDSSSSGERLADTMTSMCDTLMKDDTIDNTDWQLSDARHGHILLHRQVIAKYVVWHLRQLPMVHGVGVHAVPLNHPLAWQCIEVERTEFVGVPVALATNTQIDTHLAHITAILQQALQRWLDVAVTVDVRFTTLIPPPQSIAGEDTSRDTH